MTTRSVSTSRETRVGLYYLYEKLGEGAFGAVRVARHCLLGEEVGPRSCLGLACADLSLAEGGDQVRQS